MDWTMEADGLAIQQAWAQSVAHLLGWGILAWAMVVATALLLMLVTVRRVLRRRRIRRRGGSVRFAAIRGGA